MSRYMQRPENALKRANGELCGWLPVCRVPRFRRRRRRRCVEVKEAYSSIWWTDEFCLCACDCLDDLRESQRIFTSQTMR